MPSAPGDVLRQLYEIVLTLASEEGRIEERLGHAYFSHIQKIDASLMPEHCREEYARVQAELKRIYPRDGMIEDVDQTVAVNLAMRLILIYDSLVK